MIYKDKKTLYERAEEINVIGNEKLVKEIALALKKEAYSNNLCGLSANQIGYNVRAFCLNFSGDCRVYFNPIISKVENFAVAEEKCVCLDNRRFLIPRYGKIEVTYQTAKGIAETQTFVGKASSIVQHQMDHLDGLMIDDIGLEIDEEFDNATEEEKDELVNAYFNALKNKEENAKKEIENDEELKQMSDAIEFLKQVQSGETKVVKKYMKKENEDGENKDDIAEKAN